MTGRCSKCGEVKPVEQFYKARRERSGRQSECIACLRVRRGNTERTKVPTSIWDMYARSTLILATGCWIWRGHISDGYGKVSMGRGQHQAQAHRLAVELVAGPIPAGCVVHHTCGNRACVSINHLEVMTASHHSLLHNLGADVETCRKGHTGDWYVTPSGDRRCRECVRERRRRTAAA